jgi:hypothetical protein
VNQEWTAGKKWKVCELTTHVRNLTSKGSRAMGNMGKEGSVTIT